MFDYNHLSSTHWLPARQPLILLYPAGILTESSLMYYMTSVSQMVNARYILNCNFLKMYTAARPEKSDSPY